jgi:hypothetical protein
VATPAYSAALSLFAPDPLYLAPAQERLAQLYEARGDLAKAAEHYRTFIRLSKNADRELQPRVAEGQRRLTRITATEGRK